MKFATLAFFAIAAAQLLLPTVSSNDYSAIQLRSFIDELTERYPFLTNDVQENDQVVLGVRQFTRDVEDFLSAYGKSSPLLPRGCDITTVTVTIVCISVSEEHSDHPTDTGADTHTQSQQITCLQIDIFRTFRGLHRCPQFRSAWDKCLEGKEPLTTTEYFVYGQFDANKQAITRHIDDSMWSSGVEYNSHITVFLYHSLKAVSDDETRKLFEKYTTLHDD